MALSKFEKPAKLKTTSNFLFLKTLSTLSFFVISHLTYVISRLGSIFIFKSAMVIL